MIYTYTERCTNCHTIHCTHNTFLLSQKHLTSGTELILIGWKIVPNDEHVQCDHRFASQPLANEPLHSSQRFYTRLQKARGTTSHVGPELRYIVLPPLEHFLSQESPIKRPCVVKYCLFFSRPPCKLQPPFLIYHR
jgi:hypothetical protein